MAKIKYSALVTGMRNKLNGSVASKNHYGDFWRNKTTPKNPQTSYQTAIRSRFAANSSAWRGLTQAQRDAWIAAAPNFPFTDVWGDTLQLTGNSLYLKLNQNLHNISEASISNPPAPVSVPTMGNLTLTFATSVYSLAWSASLTGNFKIEIFAAANIGVGRKFVKNMFKFVGVVSTLTSPADITTMLSDRYGTLQSGTNLWVRALLVSTDSGQQGQASQTSLLIA